VHFITAIRTFAITEGITPGLSIDPVLMFRNESNMTKVAATRTSAVFLCKPP